MIRKEDRDVGFVCDVCGRETCACLSLCPDCNNTTQGAIQELELFVEQNKLWMEDWKEDMPTYLAVFRDNINYCKKRIRTLRDELK